jgi:hypothetical protein
MQKKIFWVLSLALLTTTLTFAQKKMSYGVMNFEITNIEGNPMAAMLKGTPVVVSFSKGKYATDINMMNGMVRTKTVSDKKKGTQYLLQDIMGTKAKIDLVAERNKKEKPTFTYAYDEQTTKKIAGYNCKKVVVTDAEGQAATFFVTNDFAVDGSQLNAQYEQLKGFPLEYELNQSGMIMTITAKDVKKEKPKAEAFETPESYPLMTMDEFKLMLSSMGAGQ